MFSYSEMSLRHMAHKKLLELNMPQNRPNASETDFVECGIKKSGLKSCIQNTQEQNNNYFDCFLIEKKISFEL